ncbi:MAG: hypothetical protein CFH01_01911 [Alphaproteobacteria bacterium MarineAlpha2_Bin1]|nr:MAG: hypothetical protein CFH01_01911 [Alphaproteobacteria bacterium MarineAlpha2_Bin1]
MAGWNLDIINWDNFQKDKVDTSLLKIIRAASLVEYRSGDYVLYLKKVFFDDKEFIPLIENWGYEEKLHGKALAKWLSLADPEFDFNKSYGEFYNNFSININADESVRGSRTGELLSRCVVEIGTSSFYSAIADRCDEPVLKQICLLIARDEFSHYSLFRRCMKIYQKSEKINIKKRIFIAIGRVFEAADDELASAFYFGNKLKGKYNRKKASNEYAYYALKLYKEIHVNKGIKMLLKALGFSSKVTIERFLSKFVFLILKIRLQIIQFRIN